MRKMFGGIVPVLVVAWTVSVSGAETDYATRMMNCTVKVFQKDSTATGFLVIAPSGPTNAVAIVTARHVFEKATSEEVLLVLRRAKPGGAFERYDHPVRIRDGKKARWTSHATEDIAAMEVALPGGMDIDPLPLASLASGEDLVACRLHAGSPALVLGFPTRFESNQAGFPVARQACIASHPFAQAGTNRTFLADFCTFAGDSGGPMFVDDARGTGPSRPLVIGMILASFRHDEKVVTMYEERTIHHPLDISTVVHAASIRETVEAALKAAR